MFKKKKDAVSQNISENDSGLSSKGETEKSTSLDFADIYLQCSMNVTREVKLLPGAKLVRTPLSVQNSILVAADSDNRKFLVGKLKPKNIMLTNIQRDYSVYSFDDLLDFEVREDGNSITSSNAGKALAGGLLFGPLGAIAGASGKKRVTVACGSLSVRIILNDANRPSITVNYIRETTKKDSMAYKAATKQVEELVSVLTFIRTNTANNEPNHQAVVDSADELRKFKLLLDEGIITPEDYENKKKQLLGL